MSIDFATLQGLTIPEGVVTQITDASGNVLWALANDKPIVLEVAKITATTYAGETAYTAEEFILLNIYPKTNGTVNVTYGGLTKTITDTSGAEEPNAQQVFFGTFNGVSDSVTTPASGELTITGECNGFAVASYTSNEKGAFAWCSCITDVIEWGDITNIAPYAFNGCDVAFTSLPDNIISIGNYAFVNCGNLTLTYLPNNLTSIGEHAFTGCDNLALTSLPDSLISIGGSAFNGLLSSSSIANGKIPIVLGPNFFGSRLVTIGPRAFQGSDYIGDGIHIILPATLREIGEMAFSVATLAGERKNLFGGTATFLSTAPPTILPADDTALTAGPFGSGGTYEKDVTIIVPKGCGDAYKSSEGWSEYANYITEAS